MPVAQYTEEFVQGHDISATGEVFSLRIAESPQVALQIDGTAGADYAVDVSPDAATWFNGVSTYSAVTRVNDGWTQPEAWVRLRVTAAAAAGETADIYLAATQG